MIDRVVNFVIMTIFLMMFLYGGYSLWDANQIYCDAAATQYEQYKPSSADSLSFDELKKLNQEVIGWITVFGTKIDYPIVQADNNEKYVNTNVKGEYSLSGSIFLDCYNKADFTDFNSILYGHHMERGAMFGDIGKFTGGNYFRSHKYGNLYVNGSDYGVEFFAFLEVDAYNSKVFAPGINADEDRQSYIEYLFTEATNKSAMDIGTEDHIILLSTCTADITNGRQILAGRITDNKIIMRKDKEADAD